MAAIEIRLEVETENSDSPGNPMQPAKGIIVAARIKPHGSRLISREPPEASQRPIVREMTSRRAACMTGAHGEEPNLFSLKVLGGSTSEAISGETASLASEPLEAS